MRHFLDHRIWTGRHRCLDVRDVLHWTTFWVIVVVCAGFVLSSLGHRLP